jgi:hypothetical protein
MKAAIIENLNVAISTSIILTGLKKVVLFLNIFKSRAGHQYLNTGPVKNAPKQA